MIKRSLFLHNQDLTMRL